MGLLSGQRRLKIFDQLTMQDVTDDKDLCRIYDKSKMQSFSHFLSLGKQRLKIPDYNDQSERILKEALRHYMRNHTPFKKNNADKLKEQISEKKKPKANLAQRHKSKTKGMPQIADNSSKATRDGNTDKSPKIIQVTDDLNNLDIQGSIELRLGLLSGQRHLAIFDRLGMHDLTEDEGLCHTYRESGVNSFSDFLALGKSRLKIPGYNKESELTLKECLRKYLKNGKQATLISNKPDERGAKKMPQTKPKQEILAEKGNRIYLYHQANDADELVKDLLYGRRHLEVFDQLHMRDITDNEDLCRIYNNLNILSFSHFIALGVQRMILPHYDEDAERLLKDILRSYLQKLTIEEKAEGGEKIDHGDVSQPASVAPTTTKQLSGTESLFETDQKTKIPTASSHVTSTTQILAHNSPPDYDQIETFVKDLLTGSSTWQPMDQIEMKDLSTNNGLRYYYELSKCTNLSDFLLLSEKRFDLRGYHKGSESRLEDELIELFKSEHLTHDILANDIPQNSPQEPSPRPQYRDKADSTLHPLVLPRAESSLQPANTTGETTHLPPRFEESPKASSPIRSSQKEVEKQAAPAIENESLHISTESTKQLTAELLSGNTHVEALDHLGIDVITSDARLANVYQYSQSNSISEFLALGKERMKIKNYGKLSERKLEEAIQAFLSLRDDIIQSRKLKIRVGNENSIPALKFGDQELEKILTSKTPEKLINNTTWQNWSEILTETKLRDEPIFHACQEIGESWPTKQGWQHKTLRDYTDFTFKELLATKNFGKKKLRTLIKAAIYLLSNRRKTILEKPPEVRLDWLKTTIKLDSREQEIYERRSKGDTLDEIGRSLNVTRERIRQIQKGILFKYRSPIGLKTCSEYLDQRQKRIWNQVAKGKLYLPKSTVLDVNHLELEPNECFALFVYTGEKVKGERFSAIIAEFLNRRYQQTANHWIDLPYSSFDIDVAISLAKSTLTGSPTPIVFKELANRLPHIDQGLLRTAIQLSESINTCSGYLVRGRLTPRKRRAIGLHVTLNKLERSCSIVSTSSLYRSYVSAFSYDNCSERDIEIVMTNYSHLFFRLGQEGWISTGIPGIIDSISSIENADLEEDDTELELYEVSLKNQQIANALKKVGIAHVTMIHDQLNADGAHIPITSLQPMLHTSEAFVRFAPGFYGLKTHIDNKGAIELARRTIITSQINPRIQALQLRSYVFSRYAGEPKDIHILWGEEMERLWAEDLYAKEDDDLSESFWFLLSPNEIFETPELIDKYNRRRAGCKYKLNIGMPNIKTSKPVSFQELLASLVYLKYSGQISCARSNMLMGRRVDGLHSVSLLATLVLLGTVQPEDDWRKAHYLKGSVDELILNLKHAYSRNPEINWKTGLNKLLLPIIDSNMDLKLIGWMKKINVDKLREHFHPTNNVESIKSADLSVSTTQSHNEGIQI